MPRLIRPVHRFVTIVAAIGVTCAGLAGIASAEGTPMPAAVSDGREIAAAPDATLIAASVTFRTLNDNKDWDTLVTAEVDDSSGNIAAFGQDFPREYPDNSGVTWDLEVGSATAAELNGGQAIITIAPNGHDTWIFGFIVRLTFDDGKGALCGKSKVVLSQDNTTVSCPLKTI